MLPNLFKTYTCLEKTDTAALDRDSRDKNVDKVAQLGLKDIHALMYTEKAIDADYTESGNNEESEDTNEEN